MTRLPLVFWVPLQSPELHQNFKLPPWSLSQNENQYEPRSMDNNHISNKYFPLRKLNNKEIKNPRGERVVPIPFSLT